MKRLLLPFLGFALAVQSQAAVTGFSFRSTFRPGDLPLIDESAAINGSWHGDLYQNGAGFQEIGGLGLATGSGIAYSQTFGPVDLTQGYGSFGDIATSVTIPAVPNPNYDPSRPEGPFNQPYLAPERVVTTTTSVHLLLSLTTAVGRSPQPIRLTLYDALGGSSYWDLTPQTPIGQFANYSRNESAFSGNLDWTRVNQFSVGGTGGAEPFHAAFSGLVAVPEPVSMGIAVGLGLLAFAVCAKLRRKALCR